MHFQIFQKTETSIENFVKFWTDLYDYGDAEYTKNISPPLNEEKILELFKWKNGRTLSKRKEKSVRDHYVSKIQELEKASKDIKPQQWLKNLGGGAIWNIFLLHIWSQKFPIFDQHVYRAMKFIKTGCAVEIPSNNDGKIEIYINEYLPFYRELSEKLKGLQPRDLDRALWKFGQFLKWLEPPLEK